MALLPTHLVGVQRGRRAATSGDDVHDKSDKADGTEVRFDRLNGHSGGARPRPRHLSRRLACPRRRPALPVPAGRTLRADVPASVVVFLVAVPLSLGIALASGAPIMAGLVAAVVGGVVAGLRRRVAAAGHRARRRPDGRRRRARGPVRMADHVRDHGGRRACCRSASGSSASAATPPRSRLPSCTACSPASASRSRWRSCTSCSAVVPKRDRGRTRPPCRGGSPHCTPRRSRSAS